MQPTTTPFLVEAMFGGDVEVGGFETATGRPRVALTIINNRGEGQTVTLDLDSAAAIARAISATISASAVHASFAGTVEVDRQLVAVERQGLLAELLGITCGD